MSKNMNIILNEKTAKNNAARKFYLETRKNINKNAIDLIKKAGLKPAQINSDMALFKEIINGQSMIYYYDRIEIKQGNLLSVISFSN